MRTFRLAMAQINLTVGDLDGNTAKIVRYIDEARSLLADLVAFPELAIPGYPPEDLLFKPHFIRENLHKMREVARASKGIAVVVGFVDAGAGSDLHNAAAIAHDGEVAGVYHKIFLPNYGVFDEVRYFKPGAECPVYVINGMPIGVNVCDDIWQDVGPTEVQCDAGAELIVNINGSPFHAGKGSQRERMLATRATNNRLFVGHVNMVGGQDELVFDGASMVIDPQGQVIARGSQFKEELILTDIEVGAASQFQPRDSRPRRMSAEKVVGKPRLADVSAYSFRPRPPLPPREPVTYDAVGEVYSALVMGTRDYVRKCGFSRVLIALSGGIDSSLVSAIAVDALGAENVLGVAMPSRYSSEGSILDAMALAENLGFELRTISIDETFSASLDALAPHFQGTEPGLAEENLQSRIRGNIIMALSNKLGRLVLTTGNKSEMAVGYATIYGDMAGGFAVIKDVPKTIVYKLAEHRNSLDGGPTIPRNVIEKPPSAELRPGQKDIDSLPPYEVLDPILKAYVEEDRSFEEIVEMGFDEEVVRRTIKMVDRSEYKRRQAPPGVKITPRNFGRDRRMPIANRFSPF
jgi:NAD+ synthase (glutamine-hydrolysing)